MSRPTVSAASRAAAEAHARSLVAGPPRSGRLVPAAALGAAVAAVAVAPFAVVGAVLLGVVAVVLVAVAVEDRRSAWRHAPAPVTPALVLPPRPVRRAAPDLDVVIDLRDPAPLVPAPRREDAAASVR